MQSRVRLLIVDDESRARRIIKDIVKADPEIELAGECASGREAVEFIALSVPDLMLLDIQMPAMNGFEVLNALDETSWPATIFVTAYEEYALRAFEVHAIDYLLKPFDDRQLRAVLQRAKQRIKQIRTAEDVTRIRSLLESLQAEKTHLDHFVVKLNHKIIVVKAEDVEWLTAEDNYVRLHSKDQSFLIRATLESLQNRLDPRRFVRVHRSVMINMDQLKEISTEMSGSLKIILQSGKQLGVARSFRGSFFAQLAA